MTRISLDPPASPAYEALAGHFEQEYGTALDPFRAAGHQPQVLEALAGLELAVAGWDALDGALKDLAVMASAVTVGCSWCIDFGHWVTVLKGVPAAKVEAVAHWRGSDLFTPLERAVLEYAEAMSLTPPAVTDEMTGTLRAHLSDAQLVELTAMIAVENLRSRTNSALGLRAQGFKDRCDAP